MPIYVETSMILLVTYWHEYRTYWLFFFIQSFYTIIFIDNIALKKAIIYQINKVQCFLAISHVVQ